MSSIMSIKGEYILIIFPAEKPFRISIRQAYDIDSGLQPAPRQDL